MPKHQEIILTGISVSSGIAIGPVFFLSEHLSHVHELSLKHEDIEKEIDRYHLAIRKSCLEIKFLQSRFAKEGTTSIVNILEAHIAMLNDPLLMEVIENENNLCCWQSDRTAMFLLMWWKNIKSVFQKYPIVIFRKE